MLPVVFFSSPCAQEVPDRIDLSVLSPRYRAAPYLPAFGYQCLYLGSWLSPSSCPCVCCLCNCLPPSIYMYPHIYYSGSRLYIMRAPLSIIYLHMYHSYSRPSIIHHLSCCLFDVLHSAIGGLTLSGLLSPAPENKGTEGTGRKQRGHWEAGS